MYFPPDAVGREAGSSSESEDEEEERPSKVKRWQDLPNSALKDERTADAEVLKVGSYNWLTNYFTSSNCTKS